jgi:hypothetical protein
MSRTKIQTISALYLKDPHRAEEEHAQCHTNGNVMPEDRIKGGLDRPL